jgi:glycosyltransferase involved in cell wall biosynthesis
MPSAEANLSIIIPTYNRAPYLKDLLTTIQNFQRIRVEIVVVDDCSTDETFDVVNERASLEQVHSIKYIANPVRKGGSHSRNRGVDAATSPYIQFVDSDDVVVESGLVAAIAELKKHPTLEFVIGTVTIVNDSLEPLLVAAIGSEYRTDSVDVAGYHWHTMGAIYTRQLVEKVGRWNEWLTGSQDWEFQARVKLFRPSHAWIPQTFGLWRQHSSSRIGTDTFSSHYTVSFIAARLSVFASATKSGMLDRRLRRRLSRQVLLHVIQLGAHGLITQKRQQLTIAAPLFLTLRLERIIARVVRFSPPAADRLVLSRFAPALLD